jgi:hypothetical protein
MPAFFAVSSASAVRTWAFVGFVGGIGARCGEGKPTAGWQLLLYPKDASNLSPSQKVARDRDVPGMGAHQQHLGRDRSASLCFVW